MGFWLVMLIIAIFAVWGFLSFVFSSFVLLSIFGGVPFLPTHRERIERAIRLVKLQAGQKIADLGAGDGRILIACAKKGARAYGFEINPFLVWAAKISIKKQRVGGLPPTTFSRKRHTGKNQNTKVVGGLATCQWKNFWKQDFSSFDIVFIYGISHIMKGLEKKLQKELKPGAKIVSFIFEFPNWQPSIKENGIYIYERK